MKYKKCKLSVNVNKIATLRNARGGQVPNLSQCTFDLIQYGAEGITVHPRPDERHIRYSDVYALKKLLKKANRNRKNKIEFNIEGYPSEQYLRLLKRTRPTQATLVPDPPDAITSNAGWNLILHEKKLTKITKILRTLKIRSSIFIDALDLNKKSLMALARINPDRIELYTEKYAQDFATIRNKKTTHVYAGAAKKVSQLGIAVNAGHDLSLENIQHFVRSVPEVIECSVGHALISESLYFGFKKTIAEYKKRMRR